MPCKVTIKFANAFQAITVSDGFTSYEGRVLDPQGTPIGPAIELECLTIPYPSNYEIIAALNNDGTGVLFITDEIANQVARYTLPAANGQVNYP
jgi:hypothetical protein